MNASLNPFTTFTVFRATVIRFFKKFEGASIFHETYNIGYRQEYDQLIADIKEHGAEVQDTNWQYIVVEEMPEGINAQPIKSSERWLKWDDESQEWKKCAKPPEAQHTVEYSN